MKKIFAAILSVALLFCGCSISKGNNDTENNAESTTNETTNTAETTLEATGLGVILSDYDTNAIVWGPGNIQNHERPVDPEKLQSQYSDLNGKWLLADDKNICLTFDEGYENGYTPKILDVLAEEHIEGEKC